MITMRHKTALASAGLLLLAGCATPPQTGLMAIDEPVDAFNAVGRPYTPLDGGYGGSLAGDVQRLQKARRLYHLSQERRRNVAERQRRACLEKAGSRRVVIHGITGDFVYCEPTPNTRSTPRR